MTFSWLTREQLSAIWKIRDRRLQTWEWEKGPPRPERERTKNMGKLELLKVSSIFFSGQNIKLK